METQDYQTKLKSLGIDRGKLETGFVDYDRLSLPVPGDPEAQAPKGRRVRKGPKNKMKPCQCGKLIQEKTIRCRTCFAKERSKGISFGKRARPLTPPPSGTVKTTVK